MNELGIAARRYLVARVRQGDISAYTASCHRRALEVLAEVHGNRPIGAIGKRTVRRWLAARPDLKPSTRRTQWSQISTFLDSLVDAGKLRSNPCHSMKAPRRPRTVPRAIDGDAVAALLAYAPDARARAVVWLMVGLGLRCVEVSRLNIEDWSRRDELLRVRGKFNHEREVPVTAEAAAALLAYLAEHPATVGPLVRSYRQPHRALRPCSLSHMLTAWLAAAGVKVAAHDGISAHCLRHTAASDVLDNSGDLRAVQQMLGHMHLSSTSVYLRRRDIPAVRSAMAGRSYDRRRPSVASVQ